jgi:hypothetical protein
MPVVTTLSGQTISVDLTSRDFEAFRSDILSSGGLADQYLPAWSDRSQFDIGVAYVEALSFAADNLSYYQDRMANEALFPSAVQRRSVIEHCKLLGYELRPAVSAQILLTVVSSGAGTIPAKSYFSVDTTDGSTSLRFETLTNETFSSAETKQIYAYEGTTYEEILGSSTGKISQSFPLLRKPLALNSLSNSSLSVAVTSGMTTTIWTEVDNFLSSSPTDEHYQVRIDEFDNVVVIFGNGVNGAIPASGSNNLSVSYRVGGGHKGNEVGIGKVTRLTSSGSALSFITSITNEAVPSGGMDKESIVEAKVNAPLSLRAMDRCVTHEDYATIARSVMGVKHAHASRGTGAFEERVVIATSGMNPIPTGSWNPYTETGSGLLYTVGTVITQKKSTPVILHVIPCRVAEIYLAIRVYCISNVRAVSVQRSVEDALTSLFNTDNQILGQQYAMSKVYEAVEGIYGVNYVDVVQMQRYPNPRQTQGGTTNVTFGTFGVGPTTLKETYYVTFTSPTVFEVYGANTGFQGTGLIGSLFVSTDKRISFVVTAGSTPPTNTCKFEIKTTAYASNIDPDYDELTILKDSTFQLTLEGGVQ